MLEIETTSDDGQVCVSGYLIIGVALILFVQARNVYPQLLLGRLFFSLGGAAVSTMVTAVLPTMCLNPKKSLDGLSGNGIGQGHAPSVSVSSQLTVTPARYRSHSPASSAKIAADSEDAETFRSSTSKIAGFAGMLTGCGALIALGVFLPLPAVFEKNGASAEMAWQSTYYVVALIAGLISGLCFIGFRNLSSGTAINRATNGNITAQDSNVADLLRRLRTAFILGFQNSNIGLGYLGGLVARASSVAISLFIPLLVNAMFLESGLCHEDQIDRPGGLPDLKVACPRAYKLSAALTGVSQVVALLAAPGFGYLSAKKNFRNLPILVAATSGMIGFPLFATQFDPDDQQKSKRALAFISVCFIGVSQIGAIVCSLGGLSAAVLQEKSTESRAIDSDRSAPNEQSDHDVPLINNSEHSALLPRAAAVDLQSNASLKGSIAGMYSLYGGAGILFLTKTGGSMFDDLSPGAPFYIMAVFNAILLFATLSKVLMENAKQAKLAS